MRVVYRGLSDTRVIAADDFDRSKGEDWVFTWTPGSYLEVPDWVGEVLVNGHHTEFKKWVDPNQNIDQEVSEGSEETPDDQLPELTVEDRREALEAMSRTELIDLVEKKEVMTPTKRTTKRDMVDALIAHYYPDHNESANDESSNPD